MNNCTTRPSGKRQALAASRILRGACTWACLLIGSLALAACGDSRSLRWKEDVKLPDGRVVTLDRYQEFKGPHEIGVGESPTVSDYWFEFKNPDTGEQVLWESGRDVGTVALLIDGGVPMLLVSPSFGGVFRRKCPDPLYLLYRYERGTWQEVPISNMPVKQLRPNMTYPPNTKRKFIVAVDNRVSDADARESGMQISKYQINFDLMKVQTFGVKCYPPFNYLEDHNQGVLK